jgi:hypothetical protein
MVRRAVVVLGLALAAAAAVWLVQRRIDEQAATREAQAKPWFLPDEAVALSLTNPTGSYALVREGARWRLREPIIAWADDSAVSALLLALSAVQRTTEVPDIELTACGLAPPLYRATVTLAAGRVFTLGAGLQSPFDRRLYIAGPDGRGVALTDPALAYQMGRDLLQLRDKRLVALEPGQWRTIVVARAQGERYTLDATRAGVTVRIGEANCDVDPEREAALWSALAGLRARRFVSDAAGPSDTLAAGLDRPDVVVTIGSFENNSRAPEVTLSLRWPKGSSEARPAMALVSAEQVTRLVELSTGIAPPPLLAGPDSLCDRRLLRFDRAAVARITVQSEAGRFVLARVVGQAGEVHWQMTQGDGPAALPVSRANAAAVYRLLYRLEGLRGLASPEVRECACDRSGARRIALFGSDALPLAELCVDVGHDELRAACERVSHRMGMAQASDVDGLGFESAEFADAP